MISENTIKTEYRANKITQKITTKSIGSFLKKHYMFFFCVLLSFAFLTLCSKNSFLYPFNDWVDINAFFTMGKGMMNGVVPYRDLFEQKGLLLYIIYGIGYLLSPKSFYGVFIIEIFFFAFYLYYSHKFYSLFVNKEFSLVILPIQAFFTVTCSAFVHGGSAEELCLPMFAYTLYSFFRHFKDEECSPKTLIINGVMAGCIFMIKYTLIGFWFSFMMFIFFDLIFKKKIKKAFISCLWFLLGMAAPILLCGIYLIINGALSDFLDCYFRINITSYTRERNSLADRFTTLKERFPGTLVNCSIYICILVCLSPIALIPLKVRKYPKLCYIATFFITMFVMFYGLRFYKYYILPVVIFTLPSFAGIAYLISLILNKLKLKKFKARYILYSVITGLFVFLSYENANYKEMINMSKEEMFQFKYAEYINQFDNPTLLNMGNLDAGLYTTTGIIPNIRFFEVQNIPYKKFPDNLDVMRSAVKNKEIMFVLYFTRKDLEYVQEKEPEIFENYDLIFDDSQIFENSKYNAFLFKVKQ